MAFSCRALFITAMDRERLKSDGNARGSLLENFVAMELIKHATWSNTRTKVFHFRTVNGKEVDLVLKDAAGRLVGVEVESSLSIGPGCVDMEA